MSDSELRPALDPSFLDGLRRMGQRSGKDMIGRMAQHFENTKPRLDEIEELIGKGDVGPLREAAHFIKGSARAVFATELHEVCYALEVLAKEAAEQESERESLLASAPELLEKIREQWRRVSSAFTDAQAQDAEAQDAKEPS